jgi:membrane associated rhomboid family serine protease
VTAAAPPPAPNRPLTLAERLRAAPVTTFFFACCLVVFGLATRTGSTEDIETLLRWGATERSLVWGGQGWRLFTSMFLHIGVVHLVWNLTAGFGASALLERTVGGARFAVIYLLSGVAGSAAAVVGHDAVTAGASGALFGVIGGVMVLHHRVLGSWKAVWAEPGLRQNIVMMALWLVMGPFMHFDSFAHGGGLLAGGLLTWVLVPLRVPALVGALVALAVFIGAALRPIPGFHDAYFARRAVAEAADRRDWKAVIAATSQKDLDPEFALYRAQALLFSDAADEAEAVLPLIATDALPARRVKTMVHLVVGKDAEAIKESSAGLLEAPDDIALLPLRASAFLAKGDGAAADRDAAHLLTLTPTAPAAILLRAQTLAASHRAAEAMVLLEGVKAEGDDAPKFQAMRLRLLILLGRRAEARDQLRSEVVVLADLDRWSLRCAVEAADGAFDEAEVACGHVGPELNELRAALSVGRDECEVARGRLQGTRQSPFSEAVLGLCALREGDVGEAERHAAQALAPDKSNVDGLLLQLAIGAVAGDASAARGKLNGFEAEATASVVWALLPDSAQALLPRP